MTHEHHASLHTHTHHCELLHSLSLEYEPSYDQEQTPLKHNTLQVVLFWKNNHHQHTVMKQSNCKHPEARRGVKVARVCGGVAHSDEADPALMAVDKISSQVSRYLTAIHIVTQLEHFPDEHTLQKGRNKHAQSACMRVIKDK